MRYVRQSFHRGPAHTDLVSTKAYYLPLLPGYAPNVNVRSSAPSKSPGTRAMLSKMTEAEEYGYDGSYFTPAVANLESHEHDGYISTSPQAHYRTDRMESDTEAEGETAASEMEDSMRTPPPPKPNPQPKSYSKARATMTAPFDEQVAEVVVFDYGVVVFLGMEQAQERNILEDLLEAGLCIRPREEDDWEIEQCHYVVSMMYCIVSLGWH